MGFASLKKFVVGENLKIRQSKASSLQREDALKDKPTERQTLKENLQQDGRDWMAVETLKEMQIPWLHRQLEERAWTRELLNMSTRGAKLQGFQRNTRVFGKARREDLKPCCRLKTLAGANSIRENKKLKTWSWFNYHCTKHENTKEELKMLMKLSRTSHEQIFKLQGQASLWHTRNSNSFKIQCQKISITFNRENQHKS